MVVATLITFVNLLVSYIFFCCGRLSPLFNMIVSVPVLLFWTVATGLLIYNMYGTLGRSCSRANWATDDGMMVCHSYKAFFAFVVIGWVCQVALLVVDIRAKRTESATGKYNKMEDDRDVKLASLENSRSNSVHDIPYGVQVDEYRDRANSAGSQSASRYASPYGAQRTQLHRVDDFFYQSPEQQRSDYQTTNYYQPTYDGMRLR